MVELKVLISRRTTRDHRATETRSTGDTHVTTSKLGDGTGGQIREVRERERERADAQDGTSLYDTPLRTQEQRAFGTVEDVAQRSAKFHALRKQIMNEP